MRRNSILSEDKSAPHLIKDAGKKVFLILDNLRLHHSKPVKAWAAERQNKIELFYLPK